MTVTPKLTQQTTFSCVAHFKQYRQELLYGLLKKDPSLRNLKNELLLDLLDIVLYGSDKYKDTINKEILFHTISFIKNTKRFETTLLDH